MLVKLLTSVSVDDVGQLVRLLTTARDVDMLITRVDDDGIYPVFASLTVASLEEKLLTSVALVCTYPVSVL